MTKQTIKLAFIAISLFVSSIVLAQSNPKDVLQTSVDSLLADFKVHRSEFESDRSKLYSFTEKAIDNNWDFAKISQLVLGKNWRRIDDQQKARFTNAFKGLLLRTYSSAIFKYTGKETIKFKEPVYKGKNNTRAIIAASGSLGDGTSDIPLSFSMYLNDDKWLIYNVAVAGVSLVTTYRSSYSQIIAEKGIDFLIDSINAKAA